MDRGVGGFIPLTLFRWMLRSLASAQAKGVFQLKPGQEGDEESIRIFGGWAHTQYSRTQGWGFPWGLVNEPKKTRKMPLNLGGGKRGETGLLDNSVLEVSPKKNQTLAAA